MVSKKQKRKKIINNSLIGLFVVALIVGVFMLATSQTQIIYNGETMPLDIGNFNLQGIEGTYETLYLGTLTSQGGSESYSIGGDNDGETTIFNNIEGGNSLILKSSLSAQRSINNYIKTKIVLPKGKLTGTYDWTGSSYQPCSGDILFKFGDKSERFSTDCGTGKGHTGEGSGTFELILEEEQEVEFSISESTNGKNQNYVGELIINFEPAPVVVEDEVVVIPIDPVVIVDDTTLPVVEEETNNNLWYILGAILFLVIVVGLFIGGKKINGKKKRK